MRIVCQQTILMKYHALFVILKEQQNLKLSSAAKCRWRLKGKEFKNFLYSVLENLFILESSLAPYLGL